MVMKKWNSNTDVFDFYDNVHTLILGWRLKPEILAQGELNVNERHHGYY